MELSLENIINRLGTSGEGTKREVLKMLKNATIDDLICFERDIRETINEMLQKGVDIVADIRRE